MNKNRLQKLAGLLKEEDFDLSDNPIPNKAVVSNKYEIDNFQIDLTDKGEDWRIDAEVEEIKYNSGRVKWIIKVVKATNMAGFPEYVDEYDSVEDEPVFRYLENIIRTDKKVADNFDKAFDEAMTDLYGSDEEEYGEDEDEHWDEWERNPER